MAAYGCLLPRILNGTFDYEKHKAVWPSTGNYCRVGVVISLIMGLNSIAILPEGMSNERFEWLNNWVKDKKNIIKTKGTERGIKALIACYGIPEPILHVKEYGGPTIYGVPPDGVTIASPSLNP